MQAAGFRPQLIALAPGEGAKSIAQAGALCEQLGAAGLDRSSFLVSLGGGVIGDLTGFVASIYMRGIPYVSVPTTLLAQVDGCIGGKTGVNSSSGKNLIGSFHHPALVIADIETLETLPDRIWHEGFAEVIKHGIIREAGLFMIAAQPFHWQPNDEPNSPQDESVRTANWELARPKLALLVERSLAIKAAIVAADERDRNDIRALLNFGHTIGHAIESAGRLWRVVARRSAQSRDGRGRTRVRAASRLIDSGEASQISAALQAHHLPTALPSDFPRAKIFAALPLDKKFANGRIRFVVAHAIGQASVAENVTLEDLRAAVDAAVAEDAVPGWLASSPARRARSQRPGYRCGRVFLKYSSMPSTTPSTYSR